MPTRVWISAQQGLGIELLMQALSERLAQDMVAHTLSIALARRKVAYNIKLRLRFIANL